MSADDRKYRAFSMNNPFSAVGALSTGLFNIHSARNKVECIVMLLSGFHLGLLCITETWLFESDTGTTKTHILRERSCCN